MSTPRRNPSRTPRSGIESSVGSPANSLRSSSEVSNSSQTNRSSRSRALSLLDSPNGSAAALLNSPHRNQNFDIDLRSPLNYGSPGTPRSRVAGSDGRSHSATPIRQRLDINADSFLRQINVPQPNAEPDDDQEPNLVIWGTNISINDFKRKFKTFIQTFQDNNLEEDETLEDMIANVPYYLQKLDEVQVLEDPFCNLNCAHLELFDPEMNKQLVYYPQEVIPIMDMAINEIFVELYPDAVLAHQIQVRPFNAEKTKSMRLLNPEDIDQMVTISGMVIRTSNLMPEMRQGFFKCTVCCHAAVSEIDRGKIIEPVLCIHCNTNNSFIMIHNRSSFVDKQMIRLQEDLEDTPVGETPYMATVVAHGNLVNTVQPGDRVTVTGIYRAVPLRVNPKQRSVKTVYKTHIDVVHFRKVDTKRLRDDVEGHSIHLSQERIKMILELSKKPDIYDRLAHSIAPSIYEHLDVKKGILLQLFGGAKKTLNSTGRGRFRSEINILLCGDPGTSKSQLLKYVYDLVPRSQYTSGKGSSAVGLTAYVTKDPETRQLVLQTGALVLADNGVCAIDEFDKMNESTRSILHEVMEQQTLSIAKAGIICQLNARTSVLAAANPVESQWNQRKTIVENVNLPHTLLSRFDLIFLLLDPQNDTYDRRLARHMITLYFKDPEKEYGDHLDMSVLRDYIAYAKEHINPRLSDQASHKLVQAYVEMRSVGSARGQISAYPRQLESLIRLSEAHAKVRLSEFVEVQDVEEAWRLHREAVKQSATDPLSGKIDVNILTTGISEAARKLRAELKTALRRLIISKGRVTTLNYQKLYGELKEQSERMVTREMYEDVVKELHDDGFLTMTGRNTIRLLHAS